MDIKRRNKELRGKEEGEERKEGEKWYGLTSMGRYTERLKAIMRSKNVQKGRKKTRARNERKNAKRKS